ncbi:PREDICTED: uncharacterized protein LOC109152007 [Ipomoea nil]|uniref:uncharacterized protein LOC109152007 n=1 Tax=Ipomoea nil TaxID=35883 RepID=UPI00090187F5|nr:PREDICTED: uncharacterized protein LOC109152007 [Ipomoea nil]
MIAALIGYEQEQKKANDGSYFIPNEKTQEVFHKIIEKCEELNQGRFEPKRHHGVLSVALGKDDNSGSVRAIGTYSTIQEVFGRPDRKQSISSGVYSEAAVQQMLENCRQNTIMEVEAKMNPKIETMDQQLKFLMKNIPGTHLFSGGVSAGTPLSDPLPTRSNCHSVDTYPITTIQSPKMCLLAVCPNGTPIVVAKGMAHPSTDETMVNHQPLLPNCVKVSVDEVIKGREQFNLPLPDQQYVTIADIVDSFAQWPMHLVSLEESLSKQNKKPKDQSVDLSTTGARAPIVGDDVLPHLGEHCKCLVDLLIGFPLGKDCIELELDKAIFHHQNTRSIFVMMNDITDLMMMNWLNVSIIQVFVLFLNQLCNQYEVRSIGFVCPTQISHTMLKSNFRKVISYFVHVMEQHKDKNFILAQYHQDSHWLLLVICIRSKSICILDPLPSNRDIGLIKGSMNLAFRSVPTGARVKKINWKPCKCPRQPRGHECGYYVMRYMYDIVTKYSSVDNLDGAFESDSPYSIHDINELREHWSKFFLF